MIDRFESYQCKGILVCTDNDVSAYEDLVKDLIEKGEAFKRAITNEALTPTAYAAACLSAAADWNEARSALSESEG